MEKKSVFSYLPFDIIREILLYNKHFVVRNKKIICINKISKDDYRYNIFVNIPKIYELSHNSWSIIMGKDKRYILRHYLKPSLIWEYSFITYSRDRHDNIMRTIPDSIIFI
jgi:hypothetical protein